MVRDGLAPFYQIKKVEFNAQLFLNVFYNF